MSKKVTIHPVTRIEGHACVELEINDENKVAAACFSVMDFRGFETFLQGMAVEMMPVITPRICGTCPHTHHLAAAKAVDKVFGATPPPAAVLLRKLLNLAGIVHSHAVHLFMLAGPDLLLGMNSDIKKRNIVGLAEKFPELSKNALRLRSIGAQISEVIGGRGTHPVSMVAGGVAQPLDTSKADTVRRLVREGLNLGLNILPQVQKMMLDSLENIEPLIQETAYLGTVNSGVLDFYEGALRLRAADGRTHEFSADDWKKNISEAVTAGSYGKVTTYHKGAEELMYRVGPLARLNCADMIDTPRAQEDLEAFRSKAGFPCHQTVMYHYARIIELLYALEKMEALVQDELLVSEQVRAGLNSPRNASAHVEAPRGLLIHDYKVDKNGIVTEANLLVATQQNISAINQTILMSAQKFCDQSDEALLNAVEFGIRCYDPCLSCATHRYGEMKLNLHIRKRGEIIRRVRR